MRSLMRVGCGTVIEDGWVACQASVIPARAEALGLGGTPV